MDDFFDLFYDHDSRSNQQNHIGVKAVPAPPSSLDDLFLTQAFTKNTAHVPTQNNSANIGRAGGQAAPGNTVHSYIRDVPPPSQSLSKRGSQSVRVGVVPPSQPFSRPLFSQRTPGQAQSGSAGRRTFTPRSQSATPQCLDLAGATPGGSHQGILKLRPVAELPEEYQAVFPFPYFNAVQSKALDDVLYSDRPVVVSAPTGSGKTVLFELAIVRLLMVHGGPDSNNKVVYMAPIKALCTERTEDWQARLGPLGLLCKELTGDTELDDYYDLQAVHVILTTPEKWDSMTRRWRDNKSLVQTVRLFLIDEVHLLNDTSRGATMEAVVSRMKTVNAVRKADGGRQQHIRFMAVSATIPNAVDVGEWLSMDKMTAACHKLDESHRPVRLRKVVLGFPCSDSQSEFRFDLSLNYKLAAIIDTYSDNKPALVFCATRKGVQQAATTVVKEARFVMSAQHKTRLLQVANSLRDSKLRDVVLHGVGFHHAGLDHQDRKTIEAAFTTGELPVLMATSTLAMGVNLPAHLVVVKSTQHYVLGRYEEYTETAVLQMIGRAGRPQFDTTATAVIMTRSSTKYRYESLLNGTQLIESSLHQNLVEHLNAEVVLSTISDVSVALEWIRSTFLYIRIMKNPKHYGLSMGVAKEKIEQNLQDLCLRNLNELAGVNLVHMDEDGFGLRPTDTGRLMARYCIAFETMKRLQDVGEEESIHDLLNVLCRSEEFKDIQLRNNEKRTLNTLNKDKNRTTIRFPMDGKIKTNEMKVNCLIQATLGCLPLQDFALSSDMTKISRSALRISKCMVEVMWSRPHYKSLLSALLLAKCLRAKLWEGSRHVSRQLTGIGDKLANMLVNAGMTSFQKLEETNPREIELIVNRHPPFGNQVKDAVAHLPKYELCIDQSSSYSEHSCELTVTVGLLNTATLTERTTLSANHTAVLLIGDTDNKVVYRARVSDAVLAKGEVWSKKVEVRRAHKSEELSINFISQDFVGLDVQSTYTPFYTGPKRVRTSPTAGGTTMHTKAELGTALPHTTAGVCLGPGRRACSHHCTDKAACAHDCCKHGVPIRTRPSAVESHQEELRHRTSSIPATPNLKRLKPSLSQFAYTPRATPQMPPQTASRNPGSRWGDMNTGAAMSSGGTEKKAAVVTPLSQTWDEIDLHRQRASATRSWSSEQDKTLNDCIQVQEQPNSSRNGSLHNSGRHPLFAIEDFQPRSWDYMEDNPDYLPDPREAPARQSKQGQVYRSSAVEDTIVLSDDDDAYFPANKKVLRSSPPSMILQNHGKKQANTPSSKLSAVPQKKPLAFSSSRDQRVSSWSTAPEVDQYLLHYNLSDSDFEDLPPMQKGQGDGQEAGQVNWGIGVGQIEPGKDILHHNETLGAPTSVQKRPASSGALLNKTKPDSQTRMQEFLQADLFADPHRPTSVDGVCGLTKFGDALKDPQKACRPETTDVPPPQDKSCHPLDIERSTFNLGPGWSDEEMAEGIDTSFDNTKDTALLEAVQDSEAGCSRWGNQDDTQPFWERVFTPQRSTAISDRSVTTTREQQDFPVDIFAGIF